MSSPVYGFGVLSSKDFVCAAQARLEKHCFVPNPPLLAIPHLEELAMYTKIMFRQVNATLLS